jgi:formylglycine-generating enzyme required for sulfatase activity
MEFHADTTELVQLLTKGHYGVEFDAEGWDRLITWIDLNCPFHGTWGEDVGNPGSQRQRRRELLKLYGNVDDDPEAIPQLDPRGRYARPLEPIRPAVPAAATPAPVDCPNWPFDEAEARRRQQAADDPWQRTVALGDGLEMRLVLIPAGEFIMGSSTGALDERPTTRVRLEKPFWMGTCEVTNRQYAEFDPSHDSHFESMLTACHGVHGHPVNRPEQPVVRVSWMCAMDFCRWLSEKTGTRFSLPTEAQWEWACRAGTATPMYFGAVDSDFSPFANLADAKLSHLARDWYILDKPIPNPTKYDDWIPKEPRFDDGAVLSIAPGKYRANPWDLHDMHGNVAEWTRTSFRPYPYCPADGRDDAAAGGRKVVRGGSWRERPQYCTSSFRLSYPPYQRVYNVGFRVVCERP